MAKSPYGLLSDGDQREALIVAATDSPHLAHMFEKDI